MIVLFMLGHITMAHTLQAVWFLEGPLHIESNQVKQSQHSLMGNVVRPDRQKGAVIILAHHRVFCTTTNFSHSLNPNWLSVQTNVIADLNIKADEGDYEVVFRARFETVRAVFEFLLLLRCCCFTVVQLVARRSGYEGLPGANRFALLSLYGYLTVDHLYNICIKPHWTSIWRALNPRIL